jgi:transposase-like protein
MSESQSSKVETNVPETEVVVKAKRRQYTAEYKLGILKEVESCQGNGDIGAILRREGVYSSMLSKWKEQRENGSLGGLSVQKRGPKIDVQAVEIARMQRENDRLRERLRQAELIIDVQKKVALLLGVPLEENNPGIAK